VLSGETEVGQLLSGYSAELPEKVASIIRGNFRPRALAQLVSSQLDVDRMDYLLRDSFMTGVKYGVFDLEWIIKSLEINQEADHLYISAEGIYSVEDYLQARYYMFRQVYFHRTLRAAEVVLRSLLRRALHLFQNGQPVWYPPDTAIERILAGARLSLAEHLSLDDSDLFYCIKQWQRSGDKILADLCARFLNRRLFRAFDLDMPEPERGNFIRNVKSTVQRRGFDPDYYFFEDNAGDAQHYFYTRDAGDPKDLIYVEEGFSRPKIVEISDISASVRGLQKGYRIHRLCFPTEVVGDVAAQYHA
jgi:HD superfamily phosphohydrolase